MSLVVVSIYLAAVLFCVGTTAWILRAWTRRRYWHKSPSDLHYVVAGTALLLSAGIGVAVASQNVGGVGYPPAPPGLAPGGVTAEPQKRPLPRAGKRHGALSKSNRRGGGGARGTIFFKRDQPRE